MPTDGVRYWLARLGGGFHARLADAGVLCSEATVHHIIARSARGIDHPLNYFLVDRGPNSAMGSRVEGFRGGQGRRLRGGGLLARGCRGGFWRRGGPPCPRLRYLGCWLACAGQQNGLTALCRHLIPNQHCIAASLAPGWPSRRERMPACRPSALRADASGAKLHMRDVVGERAFEVAQAACNLYHGVLYSGRRRGVALKDSLRELREGAFALAEEAIAARQAREARRAARGAGCTGGRSGCGGAPVTAGIGSPAAAGSPGAAAGAADAEAAAAAGAEQRQSGQPGSQARSLKRQRCPGSAGQLTAGSSENEPLNAAVLSPTQQQQERRRRLSAELSLAAALQVESPGGAAAAAGASPTALAAAAAGSEGDEEAEASMAALSLNCSPGGPLPQAAPEAEHLQHEQEQQGGHKTLAEGMAAADFSSLRARLRAALGVTA